MSFFPNRRENKSSFLIGLITSLAASLKYCWICSMDQPLIVSIDCSKLLVEALKLSDVSLRFFNFFTAFSGRPLYSSPKLTPDLATVEFSNWSISCSISCKAFLSTFNNSDNALIQEYFHITASSSFKFSTRLGIASAIICLQALSFAVNFAFSNIGFASLFAGSS